MSTAARRIQASTFAPILEWTKGAEINLMHDVVEYMNDAIREAEEAKRKAENDIYTYCRGLTSRKLAGCDITFFPALEIFSLRPASKFS